MRGSGRVRKFIPLFAVLGLLLGAAGYFWSRPPLLIVTDLSFEMLYGPMRLAKKRAELSLTLFRRVIPVAVSESASPGQIAVAAEAVSQSPFAVFFPYRYIEGARLLKGERPELPVLAFGGRTQKPRGEDAFAFIRTDLAQDYYRAGLCASVFAGEGKEVIVFSEDSVNEENRSAFRSGLQARNFTGLPVFLDVSVDYFSYSNVGCAVVAGPASKFLERNLDIPVIYFTWTDPTLAPRAVKVVFDDSPWGVAAHALKFLGQEPGEALVPSDAVIRLMGEEKKYFRTISGLLKEEFQKN